MLGSSSSAQIDFDWQQLRQLAGGDASFELELIAIFLEDTEAILKQLRQAIASQNSQTIIDLAHAIRGSSANVGACALARSARQLEQLTHNSQLSGSLASLSSEANQLLSQMRYHYQILQSRFPAAR